MNDLKVDRSRDFTESLGQGVLAHYKPLRVSISIEMNPESRNVFSHFVCFLFNLHDNLVLCLFPGCTVGCPTGSYESSPCTNFGDRVCTGKIQRIINLVLYCNLMVQKDLRICSNRQL